MCEDILHNSGLLPMPRQQRFHRAICHANPFAPSRPPCNTAWTSGPVAGAPASCLHSETPDVQNTDCVTLNTFAPMFQLLVADIVITVCVFVSVPRCRNVCVGEKEYGRKSQGVGQGNLQAGFSSSGKDNIIIVRNRDATPT